MELNHDNIKLLIYILVITITVCTFLTHIIISFIKYSIRNYITKSEREKKRKLRNQVDDLCEILLRTDEDNIPKVYISSELKKQVRDIHALSTGILDSIDDLCSIVSQISEKLKGS